MSRTVKVLAACVLLAGCASDNFPGVPGVGTAARVTPPPELFSYAAASDRSVRITVGQVVSRGEQGFIPSDPNWLQVPVTVSNIGSRTISFSDVKAQLADGTVVNSASTASELLKPPSMVTTTAGIMGLGAASTLIGAFIFPPAALIGGAAIALAPAFMGDRVARTVERLNREGLHPGPIAPGTSVAGVVFLPAVRGQTALIVFYEVGGSSESLRVDRVQP